jgi:predicted MFS family arabinose efflux permease
LLNAVTFLASALLNGLMRLDEPPRRGVTRGALLHDLREGWVSMSGQPVLRFLLGGLFLQAAVAIGLTVLLLPLLTGPLGQSDDPLGLLLALVGLGTMVGAPLGLWLFGRYVPLQLAALATLGIILSMATVGVAQSLVLVAVALLANGILTGVADLVTVTTVQRSVPGDQLGRAFGLMFWVLALGQVFGAIGGSLLLRAIGPSGAVLALSGVCAAIGTVFVLTTVGARPAPSAPTVD